MIAVGLGVTATIRVGNQKGKADFENMRRIAFSLFLQVFLIEAVFAVGFILLKDILPTFYIDNVEVILLAAQLLIVAALFQLSDGLQVVILGALRGLQDVIFLRLFVLSRIGWLGFRWLGILVRKIRWQVREFGMVCLRGLVLRRCCCKFVLFI